MDEIRIYFEGSRLLRSGFGVFFAQLRELARKKRCGFSLIAGGSRDETRKDFEKARRSSPNAWNVLLIDSEGPCPEGSGPAGQVFWMVEMMESWFHADKEKLQEFYGSGFEPNRLARNPNVELIPKADLIRGLKAATSGTTRGDYFRNKSSHSTQLLERIRPELVRKAAPQCERLFAELSSRLT